jgi:hypothetical protein
VGDDGAVVATDRERVAVVQVGGAVGREPGMEQGRSTGVTVSGAGERVDHFLGVKASPDQ